MLQLFFSNDEICEDLLSGPMGPYLPSLAVKLSELGYSRGQARRLLRTADALGRWLQQQGVGLTEATATHVRAYAKSKPRTPAGKFPDTATGLTHVVEFLKPWGILCQPLLPCSPADQLLQKFHEYLQTVRGLALATRRGYSRYLRRFLKGIFGDGPLDWSRLTTSGVCHFVETEIKHTRGGKGTVVSSMRTFLRFLVSEGLISKSLIQAVPRVRRWYAATLPHHLSAEELQNVLAACQSPWAGSRRERAFVLLLARLGVRGGEARQLCLEDIEWTGGLIHIRRAKTHRERVLPLPADVGALLADYLQHERPRSPYREVFLTASTPHRPITNACGSTWMVQQFLERIGVHGHRLGTHCLRHTAATQMVRNGASLKDVADVLGHRSLRTTGLYVKLDELSLERAALPWPGGER
jgi:site-specific recombinase XerD